MKRVLLFMVTIMLFFLYLVPLIWTFVTPWNHDFVGFAYTFWYIMMFILTLLWGDLVRRHGCWFFQR